MKVQPMFPSLHQLRRTTRSLGAALALVFMLVLPELALATPTGFQTKTCGFLTNITGLLNIASIAVVTIGIIFAGYQIAFAHKRISDVAPILIGALLIGAAGQLATWIIGTRQNSAQCGDITTSIQTVQQLLAFTVA